MKIKRDALACLLQQAYLLKGIKILIRNDKQAEKCFMANNLSEVILQWLFASVDKTQTNCGILYVAGKVCVCAICI